MLRRTEFLREGALAGWKLRILNERERPVADDDGAVASHYSAAIGMIRADAYAKEVEPAAVFCAPCSVTVPAVVPLMMITRIEYTPTAAPPAPPTASAAAAFTPREPGDRTPS